MARPIPVFEFVLAAYALTGAGRGLRPTSTLSAEKADIRVVPAGGAPLACNVCLSAQVEALKLKFVGLENATAHDNAALPPGTPTCSPDKSAWLGECVESP